MSVDPATDNIIRHQIEALYRIEGMRRVKALAVPFLALIILIGLISADQPKFLSVRSMTGLAIDAAPILMLVIGATTVILVGGIDLSIATMASFAAVATTLINPVAGDWAIPIVLVIAASIGAAQGFVHVKAQIPSFVVSFGTLAILYGITHYISHATAAPLSSPSAIISFLGGKMLGVPNGMITVLVLAALLMMTYRFTRLGRDLYAVGASERAALIAGVKIVRVKMLAFAISAVCASLAGLLLLAQTMYSSPAMANNYLLTAIVGVVVGGTAISGGIGGVGCAILGGLIAVVVRIGTVIVGLNPAYQNIVFGVVILVAVALTIDRQKIGIIK